MENMDYKAAFEEYQEAYQTLESDFLELQKRLKDRELEIDNLTKQVDRLRGYGEENKLLRQKIKHHDLEITLYKMRTGRNWRDAFHKHFKTFDRIAWKKRKLQPAEIDFMRYITAGLTATEFARAMGWKEQSAHQYRWFVAQKLKDDLNGLSLKEWLQTKYGSKVVPVKIGKLSAAPD